MLLPGFAAQRHAQTASGCGNGIAGEPEFFRTRFDFKEKSLMLNRNEFRIQFLELRIVDGQLFKQCGSRLLSEWNHGCHSPEITRSASCAPD